MTNGMNNLNTHWILPGFALFIAALLSISVLLNHRHYSSSRHALELGLQRKLNQQAALLTRQIEAQELVGFAKLESPMELEVDLFTVSPTRVQPAFLNGLSETISPEEAESAFRQGLSLMPSEQALPHLKRAAQREINNSNDLYLKIGTLFNILELEQSPLVVCRLLFLLDLQNPTLTPSQKAFFENLLNEQVAHVEPIRKRYNELSETALRIDQALNRKKGNYRLPLLDRMLAVNDDGTALLYTPSISVPPPYRLTRTSTSALKAPLITGQFLVFPPIELKNEQSRIRKQYSIGNALLGLMLLTGILLVVIVLKTQKRQQELGALRTEFIATVSHELRTPLSLIRLHAETLYHGRLPSDRIPNYHQTILTETERLSGIVNNVLDFSRIERGKMEINREETNLSEYTANVLESFRSRFNAENFNVSTRIKQNIHTRTDPLAYSQILYNLLDNAVKYSDDTKEITILLDADDSQVTLQVADRGIGIPAKIKKKIFDNFVRSGDSLVTARRGSGIGLSVAKRLTELMNGTIDVTDNQPNGSVFTVKLEKFNEAIGG